MNKTNSLALESNWQFKIIFDEGILFSNANFLLIIEYASKFGIECLLNSSFKTNNSAVFYYHTDRDNFLPII